MDISSSHLFNRFFKTGASTQPNQSQLSAPTGIRQSIDAIDNETLASQSRQPQEKDGTQFIYAGLDSSGNGHYFSAERQEAIDAVLERLSPEQQHAIRGNSRLNIDLMENDQFTEFANSLTDEELNKAIDAFIGLATSAELRIMYRADILSPANAMSDFMDIVSAAEPELRQQILDQAVQYASKVHPGDSQQTYTQNGHTKEIRQTANDLVNFVGQLKNHDNPERLINNLQQLSATNQSHLLEIYSLDQSMGDRVSNTLQNHNLSDDVQGQLLEFLSSVSKETAAWTKGFELSNRAPDDDATVIIDIDDFFYKVGYEMMTDTLDLIENYSFTDEQLLKMTSELNSLDRSNQRAYLEITTTGFKRLFGNENSHPIDMSEHEEAFATISALREDEDTRNLVFFSRMGEQRMNDNGTGSNFYYLKGRDESAKDFTETVEALVTHAWLNQKKNSNGDISDTLQLVKQLGQLSAKERDASVDRVWALSFVDEPLINQDHLS